MTRTEERVLQFCNNIRAEYEKKPRKTLAKGKPDCLDACVIANTISVGDLKAEVGPYDEKNDPPAVDIYEVGEWMHTHELPKYVAEFARRFDDGKYPHLVK